MVQLRPNKYDPILVHLADVGSNMALNSGFCSMKQLGIIINVSLPLPGWVASPSQGAPSTLSGFPLIFYNPWWRATARATKHTCMGESLFLSSSLFLIQHWVPSLTAGMADPPLYWWHVLTQSLTMLLIHLNQGYWSVVRPPIHSDLQILNKTYSHIQCTNSRQNLLLRMAKNDPSKISYASGIT